MTKKYAWKTGAAILCVCTLTAGLLGCGTEEKSEEEKILRVVTDGRLYNDVEFAARFLEGVDSGIEVRIQRLPDKQGGTGDRDSETADRDYGRKGTGCIFAGWKTGKWRGVSSTVGESISDNAERSTGTVG